MKLLAAALALWTLLLAAPATLAAQPDGLHAQARHKSGPVSIRGVIQRFHNGGFTLKTISKGSYEVTMQRQTQVTESKHRGSFSLADGDHVGVHGFMHGRLITAIRVEIFPVKPKAFSVRGVVTSAGSSGIVIVAAGRTWTAKRTGGTSLQVTNGPSVVQKGDRVLARLQADGREFVAIRIRVYSRKIAGKHVVLKGTLAAVQGSAIVLVVGKSKYSVRLSATTTVHVGTATASAPTLRSGQHLTVHACCDGGPLTATSIHILTTKATHPTQLLRGQVLSLQGDGVVVRTPQGTISIVLDRSTPVTLVGTSVGAAGIQIGDDVSVRSWKDGSRWRAKSVHILAASRRPRVVDGRVVSSSRSGVVVATPTGKQYSVGIDRHTIIVAGAKPISFRSIHAGDRVKAAGHLSGSHLAALRIQVTPVKSKPRSVRGIVITVSSTDILVAGDDGARYRVRPARGVQIDSHGAVVPTGALFRGARIRARGVVTGGVLIASSVSVTVKSRTIKGRIARITPAQLQIEATRSTLWTVDVQKGIPVTDVGRAIAIGNLHIGAYATIQGYLKGSTSLRAVRIDVYHPRLTIIGTIITGGSQLSVKTSSGKTFGVRLSSGAHVIVSRLQVSMSPADLAAGMRVHAAGTVGTDGVLQVSQITVRLSSQTVSGQVTHVESGALTVQAGPDAVRVRILPMTTVTQGSRGLKLSDLVAGDDVTVSGYRLGSGSMIARRVVTHRQRVTIAGTVATLTADGFTVNADDGTHRIITTGSDLGTGQVAVGATVRIHGYLRGDGVVVATTVTVK